MAHSNSPVSTTNTQLKPFKTYALASARIYEKSPYAPDHQWKYFDDRKGMLAFGRERSNLGGANPSTSIGHGAAESEIYWFRLTSEGRVWTFRLPTPFEYKVDKPFFHVFAGPDRLWAFRFDEDHEAAVFCRKVQDRTCPHLRDPALGATRPSNHKTIPKPRPRRVSTSMISQPQPNSFVHVSHVGFKDNVVETSRDINPEWGTMVKDMRGFGITNSICEEHLDYVEGWLAGAKHNKETVTKPVEQDKVEAPPAPPVRKRTLRRKPEMYFG